MSMRVVIVPHNQTAPVGKLADAELHFNGGGDLDGLKLIGFSIWERRTGGGRNVTFPARQFSVNGERRSFALLRPTEAPIGQTVVPTSGQERIKNIILEAYAAHEAANA